MKIGTILRIDHAAYGRYAIVVCANKSRIVVVSESDMELKYDPNDAAEFEVVGQLVVGAQYSHGGPRKFRRVVLQDLRQERQKIKKQIDVRVDNTDGSTETSIPIIRLRAFYLWCEVQP